MFQIIILLFLIIVIPPFVSSKQKNKNNKFASPIIIIVGISIVILLSWEYFSLFNFWNFKYEFKDGNKTYTILFPRKPKKINNKNRIDFIYNDQFRSLELNHIKSKIEFNIENTIDIYTENKKLALISNEFKENVYTLRFNKMDEKERFIIIHKKIYLLDDSIIELSYSYLKSSQNAVKDIDKFLNIKITVLE